jgi:hypothetical protein
MEASPTCGQSTLTGIPPELVLHIACFLDRTAVFKLTGVCRRLEKVFQRQALCCAWNKIKSGTPPEVGNEIRVLNFLSRSLLLDVAFRNFGSGHAITKILLHNGANFKQARHVLHKLLEDTFRKYSNGAPTQLLLQNGADFNQVPCGLHKLLEDTFRRYGDGVPTQLLLQNGADFNQVLCGLDKLLEDTFRKYSNGTPTQLLLQNGADLNQVPCGLHKLLEDTFRRYGNDAPTQLLLQHGAKARIVV